MTRCALRDGSARLLRLALVALAVGVAAASRAEAPATDAPLDLDAIETRRGELTAQIEALSDPPSDAKAAGRLERLERVLSQIVDEVQRSAALEAQLAEAGDEAPQTDGPFSLSELDAALAALEEAEDLDRQAHQAVEDAAKSLESARAALEELERRGRQARDGEPPAEGEAEAEAEKPAAGGTRVEIAARTLDWRRAQHANARRALALQERITSGRREAVQHIAARVEPTPEEREERLHAFEEREARINRLRERAELDVAGAQRRWERLQGDGGGADAAYAAEVAARRAELAAHQKAVALLGKQLDRIDRAKELLNRRFALLTQPEPERSVVQGWIREGDEALDALARDLRQDRAAMEALVQERTALAGEETTPDIAQWRALRLAALDQTVASYESAITSAREARDRERRIVGAARDQVGGVAFSDRLKALRVAAADAWSFEVLSSEDRSVTVGKITIAVLTFVLFLFLARIVTSLAEKRIFPRLGLDEGAAHAYQSLAYYALLAIAFLIALRVVNIPLTAFAVVGGALAIGVGFGSQNIVNNFISGLILLAERPIKRGDLVDVDGTYGNIERIGLRSTRVRTGANIHVIVPNSAFLENRVVNWTHNDAQVRISVSVGVAYGSPTRTVEKLIRTALEEHVRVQEAPRPIILFNEFGDNSLNFEAHFWVRVRSLMDRMQIESDLRFRIDELFREASVVIAFPQRDVHFDAAAPIPVRLVEPERDSSETT